LPVARDIDVGHVAGVVDTRLPLYEVIRLVLLGRSIIDRLLVQRLAALVPIDWVLGPLAVQVDLAGVRVERVLVPGDRFPCRDHESLFRGISVDTVGAIYLLELGHVGWPGVTVAVPLIHVVANGDLAHEGVVIATSLTRDTRIVGLLVDNCTWVSTLAHLWSLRLSHLH